jgi:peptidoglycan/xylan/chitin deacetylase (PgdA/CDA1 family)
MRPPFGATDLAVTQQSGRLGLAEVLWDVDTRDWRDRDTATVVERVLTDLHPGAVVIMHDVYPSTVAAVPMVLAGMRR